MPRKLDMTEEEKQERRKAQRRVCALRYYHANNPSKNPRKSIDEIDSIELRTYLQQKQMYHRQYYEKNKEKLLQRSNNWNKEHKQGLAITTNELP
jgi:hypothetical protein